MTALPSQQHRDEQQTYREMARVMAAALAKGKNTREIIAELIRNGWPQESAEGFVRRTLAR